MFRLIVAVCLVTLGSALAADDRLPDISAGERLPGKFIWFDLIATDATEAQRFYRAIFGWDFTQVESRRGSYALIMQDGQPLGGIFQPSAARPASLWLAAISVSDIEHAKAFATANGAEIVLPVRELPDLGKRLLIRDPQGALVALIETTRGDPADGAISPGEFFWMDLFTTGRRAAADFYRDLAGYEVDEHQFSGLTRLVLASQGYARAGIAPLPEEVDRPGWLPYILVDDVRATAERARQAGGQLLVEPAAGLLDGRLAVIADPSGGVIGIIEPSDDTEAGQ
jgi:predicted enzyme related to lactoylglutathione lyase